MFIRYLVSTAVKSKSNFLTVPNQFRLWKFNFCNSSANRINPRNTKRLKAIKGKEIKKFRGKTKDGTKNGGEQQSPSQPPPPSQGGPSQSQFKINIYSVGGVLIVLGSMQLWNEARRVKGLPKKTIEEFEQEYLLHGEVRAISLLGSVGIMLTGCTAEVILYNDESRDYQRIAIVNSKDNVNIISLVKEKEREMKIKLSEQVIFRVPISETLIIIGLILIAVGFSSQQFRKYMNQFSKSVEGKKFGGDKISIEFKSIPRDKLKDEIRKTTFPADSQLKKEKTQPPPNPLDIISKMLVDTNMEQFDRNSDIKFKDVAGLHSAKMEVKEFLDYLNNPSKFIRLGAKLPRGAMLLGPPGCGKTLLIKALANESNVPFYYKAGSEFVDMIGGVGAKRMRELFSSARNNAPAIIFIDEIDAIGKKRAINVNQGGDSDQTLNQLLVEMDGMGSNVTIIVFAATNRPDVLDTALVRPGRFDRHILIDLPVLEERKEIFSLYLSKYKNKLESSVTELKDKLALQTPGMAGADIANLCNEAALTAAKLDYNIIKDECFDIALERIVAGAAKKTNFLSQTERKIVAYHEAGHVLVGWVLKNADPILKVSIVPRTSSALGFSQLNVQERYLLTTDVLIDRIAVLLGGRAAESIIFNCVTSGAHDDLKKVKKIVYSMIRQWGMSKEIGHLSYNISEEDEAYGIVPYSKKMQEMIEQEASSIITKAYKLAESLLQEHKEKLELLAQELLKTEILTYKDIELLIGPRQVNE